MKSTRAKKIKQQLIMTGCSVASTDTDEETPASARMKHSTRSTRATCSNNSTRSTRSSRAKQAKEDESRPAEPISNLGAQYMAAKDNVPPTINEEEEPVPKKMAKSELSNNVGEVAIPENATAAKSVQSPSISSPALRHTKKTSSPNTSKSSPMPIPGFSQMSHVKEKASAYEKYVRHSNSIVVDVHECSSSDENATPQKRQKMTAREPKTDTIQEVPDTPDKNDTPSISSDTPQTIKATKVTVKIEPPTSKAYDTPTVVSETPESTAKAKPNRRSSTKRLSSVKHGSGITKSKSAKRSSLYRQKMKISLTMEAAAAARKAAEEVMYPEFLRGPEIATPPGKVLEIENCLKSPGILF